MFVFGGATKFLPWRYFFAPELGASGPESVPSKFFTHSGRPTPENYVSVFLTGVRQKPEIVFGGATKWCKIPTFPWRDCFAPELDVSGPKNVPLWFFTHFSRPSAEKYVSVFLTGVRQNGVFDWRAIKTGVRSF